MEAKITHGEGNGTPLQYSCLENSMDGGAWEAAVHGVAKSQTRLTLQHSSPCTYISERRPQSHPNCLSQLLGY